jgi:hypothetical protein
MKALRVWPGVLGSEMALPPARRGAIPGKSLAGLRRSFA